MKISFVEYLVEQKIVSPENMMNSIIEQHKLIPYLPQIIFENKILSANEILKIINLQKIHRIDFISAANLSGFMNQDKRNLIEGELAKYHTPIVNIILKNNFAKVDQIVKALDDYLSKIINAPAFNSNENDYINLHLISDIKSLLNLISMTQLKSLLFSIKSENIEPKDKLAYINEFLQKILAIKGIATFANAKILIQMCIWIEQLTVQLQFLWNDQFSLFNSIEKIELLLEYCLSDIEAIEMDQSEKVILDKINKDNKIKELKLKLSA